MKKVDKRKDKGFEIPKNQPEITVKVKDLLEALFEISNIPVKIRKPTKEEIEFFKKHNQPIPLFTIERGKNQQKKVTYIE